MFSLSPIKIMIIIAVILVVMGPDKLPEAARTLGNAWRSLRTLQEKIESEVREVVPDLPKGSDIVRMARNPVNILNNLAERVTEPEAPTVVTIDDEEPEEPTAATSPPTLSKPAPSNQPRDKDVSETAFTDPSLN